MYKEKFLSSLRRALRGLPRREVRERISFYSEMIDDKIEDGLSERDAVSEIGAIDDIAAQARTDTKAAESRGGLFPRKLTGWEVAAIIIGFPIWLPLLLAVAAVALALYAVIFSLVVAMWAIEIPFFAIGFISKYLLVVCKEATHLALSLTKMSVYFLK